MRLRRCIRPPTLSLERASEKDGATAHCERERWAPARGTDHARWGWRITGRLSVQRVACRFGGSYSPLARLAGLWMGTGSFLGGVAGQRWPSSHSRSEPLCAETIREAPQRAHSDRIRVRLPSGCRVRRNWISGNMGLHRGTKTLPLFSQSVNGAIWRLAVRWFRAGGG